MSSKPSSTPSPESGSRPEIGQTLTLWVGNKARRATVVAHESRKTIIVKCEGDVPGLDSWALEWSPRLLVDEARPPRRADFIHDASSQGEAEGCLCEPSPISKSQLAALGTLQKEDNAFKKMLCPYHLEVKCHYGTVSVSGENWLWVSIDRRNWPHKDAVVSADLKHRLRWHPGGDDPPEEPADKGSDKTLAEDPERDLGCYAFEVHIDDWPLISKYLKPIR